MDICPHEIQMSEIPQRNKTIVETVSFQILVKVDTSRKNLKTQRTIPEFCLNFLITFAFYCREKEAWKRFGLLDGAMNVMQLTDFPKVHLCEERPELSKSLIRHMDCSSIITPWIRWAKLRREIRQLLLFMESSDHKDRLFIENGVVSILIISRGVCLYLWKWKPTFCVFILVSTSKKIDCHLQQCATALVITRHVFTILQTIKIIN